MKDKIKTVEIDGTRYQLGRFNPVPATQILMGLIGTVAKAQAKLKQQPPQQPTPVVNEDSMSGEEIARGICGAAFVAGLDDAFHEKVQKSCIAVCLRLEADGTPMPITTADGIVLPDIADDFVLIMRLVMEVLVFNYSDFFGRGGMKSIGLS